MRVTIRLFGRLHDLAGTRERVFEVRDGACVRDAWDALVAECPGVAPYARSMSAAVNEDFAKMDAPLRDGDEVAFLPPVSGG
jgi:molybdopterin converting factor subunit 1